MSIVEEDLVTSNNFYLGCRVCRGVLLQTTSIFLDDQLPEINGVKYANAFAICTGIEIDINDGFPQRLCSDCAAKLTIAFQFRSDAIESDRILRKYDENEKNENELYDAEDVYEYDALDEEILDEEHNEIKNECMDGTSSDVGNDAVSFLTGILKKTAAPPKKIVKRAKQKVSDMLNDAERKHNCNVCHKKFQKRSNLIDHLRLHANVKVFSCEFCEKSFVQAGNFKAHLRTHTKEKPYQCTYCSKAYSQSSSLKIHIRSHTQEKNYLCDVCHKGFTNASDLGKHRLIHDPVKRYRCEECDRPFTQKIHLKKHLEKHHPNVDFDMVFKSENIKEENTSIIFEECIVDEGVDDEEEVEVGGKNSVIIVTK